MNSNPSRGFSLALLTFGLSLGLFMNVLDTSIANVAIPYIAGSLNVSPSQGTWVITSFAVSTAIVLPLTGWLAKQFGEVKLFIYSTFFFTLASVLCGLSVNLPMLIMSRVLQGIFAAPMIPLSQSLLLMNYPPEKKGLATGLWVMTAVIAPVLGPVLGGYITDNFTWSWIFYINVPIGMISVFLCHHFLAGRETPIQKQPIDLVGLILVIIGIGCLQITLDKGQELDWYSSNLIRFLTGTSIIAIIIFLVWETFEKNPIIDLSLFQSRNFTLGVIALMCGYGMYFGNVVIYPLWLQTQMGYTALWAGIAVMPMGILALFFTPIVGASLSRIDAKWFVLFGFFVFAMIAFWNSSFNTNTDIWHLSEPRFLMGIGISCFFSPLLYIIVSDIEPIRNASALGIASFLRILGGSFGTSIYVSAWENREKFHHARIVEYLTDYHQNSIDQINFLTNAGFSRETSFALIDNIIEKQSFLLSVNELFWITGYLFLFLCILVLFVKKTTNKVEAVFVE